MIPLPKFLKSIPTHMDFEGQRLAEKIFHFIIISFGVVGFLWGYHCEQFSQTFYILSAGFLLSCLLVLPPWPIYRRHPIDWQKPRSEQKAEKKDSGKKKLK